ncbi:hypothetical protein [Nocardia bhagyanarayanae]|uniref:Uncharacterized protein n=1 Tax=Nocardia bhagyanarayanae TaxID=1215925 RepID=A0A543EXM4_9NOCA|nr:hypothetical protein [Nocardia bhagyanarayanae]TQM26336.1 hypothetical protein FB390_6525 [Nocardia bhagyanarayanae]
MSIPTVPSHPGAPSGYAWRCVWPESRTIGWSVATLAALVCGAACSVVGTVFDDRSVVGIGVLLLLLGGIAGITCLVMGIEDRPEVRAGDGDNTFVLRYLPVRLAPALAGLAAVAVAAIWLGIVTGDLEPTLCGIALLVALFLLAGLALSYRRTARLSFSPDAIRITTRNFDWEFPWDAAHFTAGFDPKGAETIEIRCPRDAVITRRTPRKTPTHLRPPADSPDGPWKIAPIMWGVRPNSLYSTMTHLRGTPALRAELTRTQLAAMLTPPPWRIRRTLNLDPTLDLDSR